MSNINFDEIDDFVRRAEEVERQVKAIMEGGSEQPKQGASTGEGSTSAAKKIGDSAQSVVPTKIPFKSREEEEAERQKERELSRRWASEIAAKEAREEREKWWRLAFFTKGVDVPEPEDEAEAAKAHDGEKRAGKKGSSSDDAGKGKQKPAAPKYDGLHYAKWDSWLKRPDDPASLEEMRVAEEEREKAQNEAFEKANPEFVASFLADQEKRASSEAAKQRRSDDLKTAGNEAFKKKEFSKALNLYAEALSLTPLSEALLNNLAATHLSLAGIEKENEKAAKEQSAKEQEAKQRVASALGPDAAAILPTPSPGSVSAADAPSTRHLCQALEFATRSAWLYAGLGEKAAEATPNGWGDAEPKGKGKNKKAAAPSNAAGLNATPNATKALFRRMQACFQLDALFPSDASAPLLASQLLELPPASHTSSQPSSSETAIVPVAAATSHYDIIEAREKKAKEMKIEKGRLLFTKAWKDGALAGLVDAGISAAQTPTNGGTDAALPFHAFPWLCQAIADLTLASDLLTPASAPEAAAEIRDALARARIDLQERLAERKLSLAAQTEHVQASPSGKAGDTTDVVTFLEAVARKAADASSVSSITGDDLLLLASAVAPQDIATPSSSSTPSSSAHFSSLKVRPPKDDDERERCLLRVRTSGLLETLLRAAKSTIVFLTSATADSNPTASLLSMDALGAAFTLFAACSKHNAKQRFMVAVDVDGGIVSPACSLAVALSHLLFESEDKRLQQLQSKASTTTSVSLSAVSKAISERLGRLPSSSTSASSSLGALLARVFDFFDGFATGASAGAAAGSAAAKGKGSATHDEGNVYARSRGVVCSHPGLLLPVVADGPLAGSAVEKILLAGAYSLQSDRILDFGKAVPAKGAASKGSKAAKPEPCSSASSVEAAASAAALLQHLALDREIRDGYLSKALSTPAPTGSAAQATPRLSGLVPCLLYFLSSQVAESGTALWHALQRHQKQLLSQAQSQQKAGLPQGVLEEAELAATHALTTYSVQVTVGALANLAQSEVLRKDFVCTLPPASGLPSAPGAATPAIPASAAPSPSSSSLAPLVSLLALPGYDAASVTDSDGSGTADLLARQVATVRGSAVAALANATVGFPSAVEALASAENALPLLLSLLPSVAATKPNALTVPPLTLQVCSYAALLLGRISSHPTILSRLVAPAASSSTGASSLPGLVKLLAAACDLKNNSTAVVAAPFGTSEALVATKKKAASVATAVVDRETGEEIPPILPPSRVGDAALISALASAWRIEGSPNSRDVEALATVCDGLVRVWAAVLSSSASPLETFVLEGGIEAVSSVVHDILRENNASKPAGTPFIRAAALGNACKIAITLSSPPSASSFAISPSLLLTSGLVDGLVGALKATSSLLSPTGGSAPMAAGAGASAADSALLASAQKNSAVALARLLKDKEGAVGKRIRELRGLEVLMTMGAGILGGGGK